MQPCIHSRSYIQVKRRVLGLTTGVRFNDGCQVSRIFQHGTRVSVVIKAAKCDVCQIKIVHIETPRDHVVALLFIPVVRGEAGTDTSLSLSSGMRLAPIPLYPCRPG